MIKLFKIEFKKILTYKIFWILTGLYFIFLSVGLLMAEFMINNIVDNTNKQLPIPIPHVTIYFFPWLWQNMAFFATIRYVLIFPAIVIIILVTNEFTFKTIRQNVINGMSKAEFLISKLLIIFLISAVMTALLTIGTLIIGISHTSELTFAMVVEKSSFDKSGKDGFKFHATIVFKRIDRSFSSIWSYLQRKPVPTINQVLLRATIIKKIDKRKKGKILCEYDFLQKRLLYRREALDKRTFRKTIEILKERKQELFYENELEIESFWTKIKRFFKHE